LGEIVASGQQLLLIDNDERIGSSPHSVLGAMSIFFWAGAVISLIAALSLLFPGSVLEPMWKLNPRAREGFAEIGGWAILLMGAVSIACAMAAAGLLARFALGLSACSCSTCNQSDR